MRQAASEYTVNIALLRIQGWISVRDVISISVWISMEPKCHTVKIADVPAALNAAMLINVINATTLHVTTVTLQFMSANLAANDAYASNVMPYPHIVMVAIEVRAHHVMV